MWSPYQSLCHTPILSATAKKTKSFFSLPGALLIHHRWSLITLRSQIFIASVGPPVARDGIPSTVSFPALPPRKLLRFHFFRLLSIRKSIFFIEEELVTHLFVVHLLSCVQFFVTSWTVAHQASLSSFTVSWNSSLMKLQTIFFSCSVISLFKARPWEQKKKKKWSKYVSFFLGFLPLIVSSPTGKSPRWLTKLIWWTLSLLLL